MGIAPVHEGFFNGWQLPAGHFVSTSVTGMLPIITYPRPDDETSQYAHNRNAYNDGSTGIRWEAPAVVQGGSWPFKYNVSAPTAAGLTIGSTLDIVGDHQEVGANYGVMSWESPTIGTHEITLTVIDQDGNTDSVVFNLVVGSTNFVFIDASATDDTGTGAIGDPLKTIQTGLWNNSDTDNSFVNKIAVFRTGGYVATADGTNGMICTTAAKPMSYIAYSGETVSFDMTVHRLYVDGSDFYTAGIDYDGSVSGSPNNYHLYLSGDVINNRFTAFNCTFDNLVPGSAGTDNPSAIQARGRIDGNLRDYVSVVRCTSNVDMQVALYIGFNSDYCVLEHNESLQATIVNSNGEYFLKAKDEHPNCTMRANKALTLTTLDGELFVLSEQTNLENIINQECCWNVGYATDITSGITKPIFFDGGSTLLTGYAENIHFYRNTGIHEYARGLTCNSSESNKSTMTKNIFYGGSVSIFPEEPQTNFINIDNIIDLALTTDLDTDGNLVGTARTNYLGTRGHEIA